MPATVPSVRRGISVRRTWIDMPFAGLCLLPAMVLVLVTAFVVPDLEAYLNQHTPTARSRLTYENLNIAMSQFWVLFVMLSVFLSACAYLRKYALMVVLLSGNVVATSAGILQDGIADPQWTSFVFANVIGMFVSLVVALALAGMSMAKKDQGV